MAMDAYLENIEMNQKQIDTFEVKIASISNEDERTRLIMTISGINYVTALTIIAEIVDIKRFARQITDVLIQQSTLRRVHSRIGDDFVWENL